MALTLSAQHRNNLVAFISEFAGTFLFLFFAFSGTALANTYAATTPPLITLIFIALSFGLSLAANVWAFYRVSGGMFNPAVTLALFFVGGLPWLRGLVVIVAQLLGGIAAAGVVSGLFPGDMAVDTALGGGTSVAQGLFIEVFLTTELVFVILMLAAEKHKATFVAPVAIGTAFFLTQLVGTSSSSQVVAICLLRKVRTILTLVKVSTLPADRSTLRAVSALPWCLAVGPSISGFTSWVLSWGLLLRALSTAYSVIYAGRSATLDRTGTAKSSSRRSGRMIRTHAKERRLWVWLLACETRE